MTSVINQPWQAVLLSWLLRLGFKTGISNQDHYVSREAETEKCSLICQKSARKATEKLGTHLGFSCTSLKRCSRHATSRVPCSDGILRRCPAHSQEHCTEHGRDKLVCNSPVWKRDFSTSGGMATAQLKIPARPPAKRIRGTLRSLTLWQDWGGVGGTRKKNTKKRKRQKKVKIHLFWLRWQPMSQPGWQPEGSTML